MPGLHLPVVELLGDSNVQPSLRNYFMLVKENLEIFSSPSRLSGQDLGIYNPDLIYFCLSKTDLDVIKTGCSDLTWIRWGSSDYRVISNQWVSIGNESRVSQKSQYTNRSLKGTNKSNRMKTTENWTILSNLLLFWKLILRKVGPER